jgi:probable rRNA maturation factor
MTEGTERRGRATLTVVLLDEEEPPARRHRPGRAGRPLAADRPRLRRLVQSTLAGERIGRAPRSVTVLVTGDRRISDLSARFLGRRRRTDVLAFPGDGADLGSVVVNAQRARREAARRRLDPVAELYLYVVHGLLHLVGYDDHTDRDVRRMRAREAAVLNRFGYRGVFDAPDTDSPQRRRERREEEGTADERG